MSAALPPRGVAAVLVALLAFGSAVPGLCAWTTNGIPVTKASGDQLAPELRPDGAGGAFVLWLDSGTTWGIACQRITADGEPAAGWPAGGIRIVESGSLVSSVAVTGGVFVLYEDDMFRTLLVPHDAPQSGSWPGVGEPLATFWARAASDGAGGLLLNRATPFSASLAEAATIRTNGSGAELWSYSRIFPSSSWGPVAANLCPDGAGGAYLTSYSGEAELRVLRIDGTGAVAAGWSVDGLVIPLAGDGLGAPDVVPSVNGGVLVAWEAADAFGTSTLSITRFESNAAPGPAPWLLTGIAYATNLLDHPRVASDGAGGLLAAWIKAGPFAGPQRLYVQRIAPTGAVAVPAGMAIGATPYPQIASHLAADGAGGGYVTWSENRNRGSSWDLYVRRFTDSSPLWPDTGLRVCDAPLNQHLGQTLVSGDHVFVAWTDERDLVSSGADIYMARITPDGVVPTLAALLRASAEPDRVELAWQAHDGPSTALVQRSRDGAEWEALAEVARTGSDRYEFTDRAVSPGERWAYRLAGADGEPLSGVDWVTIPRLAKLAIRGFAAGGAPVVTISLADEAPARLEVFDVAGRRVEARELAGGGVGEQRVALARDLAPGLYLLRLEQSGMRVNARAARLR